MGYGGATGWTLRLAHLADLTPHGTPTDLACEAMAALTCARFLRLTVSERSRQVHRGGGCRPVCGLCQDIALRHALWAARKLARHLRDGPPSTRGEPVRDWKTILAWVSGPDAQDLEIDTVRRAMSRHLPSDHALLPLVMALNTQLLPSPDDARAPRRMRDVVGDPRRGALAQMHEWAVKPDRDLAQARAFETFRHNHPDGVRLLTQVLRQLDYGDPDPYVSVLSGPDAATHRDQLAAVIRAMLADDAAHDWFLTNVEARQTYNQDLLQRRFRYTALVDEHAPADHDLFG